MMTGILDVYLSSVSNKMNGVGYLIQWAPHRREIRLFERLSKAPVYLHTPDELSVKSELDGAN